MRGYVLDYTFPSTPRLENVVEANQVLSRCMFCFVLSQNFVFIHLILSLLLLLLTLLCFVPDFGLCSSLSLFLFWNTIYIKHRQHDWVDHTEGEPAVMAGGEVHGCPMAKFKYKVSLFSVFIL